MWLSSPSPPPSGRIGTYPGVRRALPGPGFHGHAGGRAALCSPTVFVKRNPESYTLVIEIGGGPMPEKKGAEQKRSLEEQYQDILPPENEISVRQLLELLGSAIGR